MRPSGPPTEEEIWKIARRTTDIIESTVTMNVCLFGSAASSLWADIGRIPDDVDIVVSETIWNAEEIKGIIAQEDDRYFLQPSRKPGATYHILYCRLPGWRSDKERRVKVDILVPPTLNLPEITEFDVVRINDIPVMPIFDLLVMKTQGWSDHRKSHRRDFRDKVRADVSDIVALLKRARAEMVSYDEEADEYRHSQEFMTYARILAVRFVDVHGWHKHWRALQFPGV